MKLWFLGIQLKFYKVQISMLPLYLAYLKSLYVETLHLETKIARLKFDNTLKDYKEKLIS